MEMQEVKMQSSIDKVNELNISINNKPIGFCTIFLKHPVTPQSWMVSANTIVDSILLLDEIAANPKCREYYLFN